MTLPLHAAEFFVEGNNLHLEGAIEVGDDERFAEALMDNPDIRTIALKSDGGDVYTAMQIGREIRSQALNTLVTGSCNSACTVAFIGGVERRISNGEFGFHRVVSTETGEPINSLDPLYHRLTIFTWGKGVDPIRFTQWMFSANGNDFYVPDEAELCSARVLKPCEGADP